MKWIIRGLLGVAVLVAVFAGYVFMEASRVTVTEVTDDVWVLKGMGGNVAVLRTDEGTVIVDTMTLKMQGKKIRRTAEELAGAPVELIINTHYHLDHTHGNPAFEAGTRVVATARTLHHLKALDAKYWEGEAAALLPRETFTDAKKITMGGKTIELFHPGPGHTDGDLVVVFAEDRVIHMGDLYFNKHYPNIDLEAGGTVAGWPAAIDAALALEFDHTIPGHGAVSDRDGLISYQRFMAELGEVGRNAAANDLTLEQTLTQTDLTTDEGYEEIKFGGFGIGLDRDFVITRAWEEATGAAP